VATFLSATRSLPARRRQPVRITLAAVLVGLFLALHGAVHTVAFLVQWELAHPSGLSYHTTVLGGRLDLGAIGIRIDGFLWLVAALGFLAVGLRPAGLRRLEPLPIAGVTVFSLALCLLGLPEASVGVVIDSAILVALAVVLAVRAWRAA
jgi:hypothetical protein